MLKINLDTLDALIWCLTFKNVGVYKILWGVGGVDNNLILLPVYLIIYINSSLYIFNTVIIVKSRYLHFQKPSNILLYFKRCFWNIYAIKRKFF